MATVNIKFFRPAIIQDTTAVMGADVSTPETITTSSSSQSTTASALDNNTYVRIVSDGNVWVTFAVSPTAVTSTGTLIYAGVPEYFKLEQGLKVAVIN